MNSTTLKNVWLRWAILFLLSRSGFAPRFTIHDDESPPKKPMLAPIGSEVALSKSLLNDSSLALENVENDENVKPVLPDCERHGFRQSTDFILSRYPGVSLCVLFGNGQYCLY